MSGKRERHFPFFGTRFENVTLYNITRKKLFHVAEEELANLQFGLKNNWTITAKEPFPFSLVLKPVFLQKRGVFLKKFIPFASRHIPGALFRYHLLSLKEGQLGDSPLRSLSGFSEQGIYSMLTAKGWEAPFLYHLRMRRDGEAGSLNWSAKANIISLQDRFHWGPPSNVMAAPTILATTFVPLGGWTLKREIVHVVDRDKNNWYGLEESFDKK